MEEAAMGRSVENNTIDTSGICETPEERLSEEMRASVRNRLTAFDMHCHLFNKDYVPDRFLRIKVPMKERFLGAAEWLLHRIFGRTDTDKWSRLAYFLDIIAEGSMEDIARRVFGYYDNHLLFGPGTILCPLMMDFQARSQAGIKGKTRKTFQDQIAEMKKLVNKYPGRILPFLAIDPRRPRVLEDVFLPAFETPLFGGVKLYPSLGYLPSHPVLLEMYGICEKKMIPVTVHCGTGSVHSSRRFHKDIPGLRYDQDNPTAPARLTGQTKWFLSKQAYADYFNHPENWRPVLERYPELRLNIAHFGCTVEWEKYMKNQDNTWPSRIIDLIYRYPPCLYGYLLQYFSTGGSINPCGSL